MFRLFFTPGWFNGYDLLFNSVGLVVALLIAAYSWRPTAGVFISSIERIDLCIFLWLSY